MSIIVLPSLYFGFFFNLSLQSLKNFKTETDFRLKTVSVSDRQNLPVRNYYPSFGLAMFFQFKTATAD